MADQKDFMGGMFDMNGDGKTDDLEKAFGWDYMLNDDEDEEAEDNGGSDTQPSEPVHTYSGPQAQTTSSVSHRVPSGMENSWRELRLMNLERDYASEDKSMRRAIYFFFAMAFISLFLLLANLGLGAEAPATRGEMIFLVAVVLFSICFIVLFSISRSGLESRYRAEKKKLLSEDK